MAFSYPDKLIAEVIAFYKDLDGRDLAPEEAVLYLDSLARLGHAFKESIRQGFAGEIGEAAKPPADLEPSDLSLFSERIRT